MKAICDLSRSPLLLQVLCHSLIASVACSTTHVQMCPSHIKRGISSLLGTSKTLSDFNELPPRFRTRPMSTWSEDLLVHPVLPGIMILVPATVSDAWRDSSFLFVSSSSSPVSVPLYVQATGELSKPLYFRRQQSLNRFIVAHLHACERNVRRRDRLLLVE